MALRTGLNWPRRALDPNHDASNFSSSHPELDIWLRDTALRAEGRTARTYVVCRQNEVVGFYCLATGSVVRAEAPGRIRRNAPDPIPVAIIGRLAVDQRHHGKGIGAGLLKDALVRVLRISQTIGCAAIMVHAIDDVAAAFYVRYGFAPFPADGRILYLPVTTLAQAL